MEYAFIKAEKLNEIPWIFEIAVGSWKLQRIEADDSTATYVGLKGKCFTDIQKGLIEDLDGVLLTCCEDVEGWVKEFGEVVIEV